MRGEVEFDNALLGDFVIVRNDGMPLYHLAVVVDDEAMEITDVIRGEDHLSNTPKHIALIRALGYREPRFGHIPMILNADRTKMSKRKSQMALSAYREEGYLPRPCQLPCLPGLVARHRGGDLHARRARRSASRSGRFTTAARSSTRTGSTISTARTYVR